METVNIKPELFQQIVDYGNSNPQFEVGGMILGTDPNIADEIVLQDNVSMKNHMIHYIPDPQQVFDTIKRTKHFDDNAEKHIVGFFHTHPHHLPLPSSEDLAGAGYRGFQIIYSPKFKQAGIYYYDGDETNRVFNPATLIQ